jgi:hypothetical protein
MEVFVVADEMIMGQGVFGIFSTHERARAFLDGPESRDGFRWAIIKMKVFGGNELLTRVCAAYNHDCLHDVYLLDGIYAEPPDAREATGDRGMIVEFAIDAPEEKRTIESL